MVEKEKQKVTLSLKPGTVDILRQKAKEVGMLIERGPEAGNGNVSEYLDSLAWSESNKKSDLPWRRVVIGHQSGNGDAVTDYRREVEFRGKLLADDIIFWGEILGDTEIDYTEEQKEKMDTGELGDDDALDEWHMRIIEMIRDWYRQRYSIELLSHPVLPDSYGSHEYSLETAGTERLLETDDKRYIVLVTIHLDRIPSEYYLDSGSGQDFSPFILSEDYLQASDFYERFLVELNPDDLRPGGRFRNLGRLAGIDPTLTLDEALALQQELRRPTGGSSPKLGSPSDDCQADGTES